jgi:apolipoprotein N-acyltransferase
LPPLSRKSLGRTSLAFLLGAATVLGFAPFGLFPLPLLALGGAIHLWRAEVSPRAAALSGYAYGLGLFLAGVSWIYVSLHQFGGMPAALAALATFLFCALLALFPAAAAGLWSLLRRDRKGFDSLLAAACWTLAEWLRGWVLTGFPWLALGYSQAPPSPLAGFAPIAGVYGLTFVLVWLAALLALSWRRSADQFRAAAVWVAVVGTGFALAGIAWTQPRPQAFSVSLLQGNIEQSMKWRPELLGLSLDTYLQLARQHPARLVVLPETALPIELDAVDPAYFDALRGGREAQSEVLLGAVSAEGPGRYFNGAVAFGARARQDYRKSHLVPFGEFTPPGFRWTLALLSIPMSDFTPGPRRQPPMDLAGEKVAVNICYEDAFGEEIIRALPDATLLVNLSNVAWFGDSLAPAQHLQIAQLRALETGRTMLRATNTGKTAVIAPTGAVTALLPAFTSDALVAEVRGYTGMTPYARWGNGPLVFVVLGVLLWGAWTRDRSSRGRG